MLDMLNLAHTTVDSDGRTLREGFTGMRRCEYKFGARNAYINFHHLSPSKPEVPHQLQQQQSQAA